MITRYVVRDQTDFNDAFSWSCLSPDVELFALHVLKSSLVKHYTNHALQDINKRDTFHVHFKPHDAFLIVNFNIILARIAEQL